MILYRPTILTSVVSSIQFRSMSEYSADERLIWYFDVFVVVFLFDPPVRLSDIARCSPIT